MKHSYKGKRSKWYSAHNVWPSGEAGMKLSKWHSKQNPTLSGVYGVKFFRGGPLEGHYKYWSGRYWAQLSFTIDDAYSARGNKGEIPLAWRGLAKEPK
jgi:hypothetical protein